MCAPAAFPAGSGKPTAAALKPGPRSRPFSPLPLLGAPSAQPATPTNARDREESSGAGLATGELLAGQTGALFCVHDLWGHVDHGPSS